MAQLLLLLLFCAQDLYPALGASLATFSWTEEPCHELAAGGHLDTLGMPDEFANLTISSCIFWFCTAAMTGVYVALLRAQLLVLPIFREMFHYR